MRMDQGGHCHVNGSFPVQNNHFRKVRHIADALTVVPPFNMWKQSPAFLDITFGPIPSSIWHDRSSLIITNYLRRVEKRPSWSFTALGALWVGDLRFLLLETATVVWWAGQVQEPKLKHDSASFENVDDFSIWSNMISNMISHAFICIHMHSYAWFQCSKNIKELEMPLHIPKEQHKLFQRVLNLPGPSRNGGCFQE